MLSIFGNREESPVIIYRHVHLSIICFTLFEIGGVWEYDKNKACLTIKFT